MKKITFVQRQQSSTYDPVSTFFANTNKKASSVAKPNIPPTQPVKNNIATKPTGSIERPSSTKMTMEANKKIQQKQKPVTNKIGRKGDHLPPKRPEQVASTKQQSIYANVGSKKNIRNTTNQNQQQHEKLPVFYSEDHKQQLTFPNVNERRSPTKPTYNNQYSEQISHKGQKQGQNSSTNDIQALKKRIKQLESNELEYMRKIEDLQAKQQKYIKIQQKYTKLQKQHKQCGTDSKQNIKKLRQKQEQLKKLLAKDDIPYNKKREVMMYNQMATLKRINRELVTRIKNYKGTDLVQVSMSQNKADVLFKEYDHTGVVTDQGQGGEYGQNVDLAKFQSLSYRIIQTLETYINTKTGGRQAKQVNWADQKKLLIQIANNCKQFSLQCLGLGWKIPSSNKQATSIYNEIEKYRYSLQPTLNKHQLNFIITEQNIEFINRMNQQSGITLELKQSTCTNWQEPQKKFKKIHEAASYYLQKYKNQSQVYQKSYNINHIILAHCLAQIGYIQAWLGKTMGNIREGLTNLNIRLKQLEELCSLGQAGKQALYLYVHSNIKDFVLKVPQLQLEVKQIGSIFKNMRQNTSKTK